MASVLVTGTSRGIGFELVRQLAQEDQSRISTIFATSRGSPSKQLQDLVDASQSRIVFISCDAADDTSVLKAAAEVEAKLGDKGLDILVNNVGFMPATPGGMRAMKSQQLLDVFNTNVVSAHRVTAALAPAIEKSKEKKIIMISTTVGSIAYVKRYAQGPFPEYKITKAAMNMLMAQYALEYGEKGFTVLAVTPGWLKTDLGSSYADLEVEVGVKATKDIILKADRSMNGKFQNIHVAGWENADGPNQYDGKEVPW